MKKGKGSKESRNRGREEEGKRKRGKNEGVGGKKDMKEGKWVQSKGIERERDN